MDCLGYTRETIAIEVITKSTALENFWIKE